MKHKLSILVSFGFFSLIVAQLTYTFVVLFIGGCSNLKTPAFKLTPIGEYHQPACTGTANDTEPRGCK
jgi:hypothetical protein